MEITVRSITDNDVEESLRVIGRAFGHPGDESVVPTRVASLNQGRGVAAFDGGNIVGFSIAYLLGMDVPGGIVGTNLLDSVAVQPTHRRRGVLTRLMDHQLRDFHERGEVLSGLGASESAIYGRYGYGVASLQVDYSISRHQAAFASPRSPEGTFRFVDKQEARERFPAAAERACAGRPGFMRGIDVLWDSYLFDPVLHRGGASAFFHVVYERNGQIDGYVTYRVRGDTLIVHDLIFATDEAHAALWTYCFGVDLMSTIEAPKRPVDDLLPWMLADPRRLRQSLRDDLWLRLVDVKQALAVRRYAVDGTLILGVRDSFCPWNQGSYRLEGGPGGARCKPTTESPDISLPASDLASAYLGGTTLSSLARAGRVEEHSSGALRRADDMFRTQLQPWWPNEF